MTHTLYSEGSPAVAWRPDVEISKGEGEPARCTDRAQLARIEHAQTRGHDVSHRLTAYSQAVPRDCGRSANDGPRRTSFSSTVLAASDKGDPDCLNGQVWSSNGQRSRPASDELCSLYWRHCVCANFLPLLQFELAALGSSRPGQPSHFIMALKRSRSPTNDEPAAKLPRPSSPPPAPQDADEEQSENDEAEAAADSESDDDVHMTSDSDNKEQVGEDSDSDSDTEEEQVGEDSDSDSDAEEEVAEDDSGSDAESDDAEADEEAQVPVAAASTSRRMLEDAFSDDTIDTAAWDALLPGASAWSDKRIRLVLQLLLEDDLASPLRLMKLQAFVPAFGTRGVCVALNIMATWEILSLPDVWAKHRRWMEPMLQSVPAPAPPAPPCLVEALQALYNLAHNFRIEALSTMLMACCTRLDIAPTVATADDDDEEHVDVLDDAQAAADQAEMDADEDADEYEVDAIAEKDAEAQMHEVLKPVPYSLEHAVFCFFMQCVGSMPEAQVQASLVYAAFAEWHPNNYPEKKVPNQKRFAMECSERVDKVKKRVVYYKHMYLLKR